MQRRWAAEEAFARAVCAALEPYGWRSLRPEMLARRVIGAVDGRTVSNLLEAAGVSAVVPAQMELADRSDERVDVLVTFLQARRWRTWTLEALVGRLLGVLDEWWVSRQRLEVELGRLVDGGA